MSRRVNLPDAPAQRERVGGLAVVADGEERTA
jgi:hypothetical protein